MDYSAITCAACFHPNDEKRPSDDQQPQLRMLPSSVTPLGTSICTDRCIVVECDKVDHVADDTADFNESGIVTICSDEACGINACGVENGDNWTCDQDVCFLDDLLACNTSDPSTLCYNPCPQSQWQVQNCQYDALKSSASNITHPAYQCHGPCDFFPIVDSSSSGGSSSYDHLSSDSGTDIFGGGIICMWGDCHQKFANQQDLFSHLQSDHLQPQLSRNTFRLPQPQSHSSLEGLSGNVQSPFSLSQLSDTSDLPPSLSCLWDNCNVSLMTSEIATFDTIGHDPKFNDGFLQHLLQNHFSHEQPHTDISSTNSEPNTHNESLEGEGSPDAEDSNIAEGSAYQASPTTYDAPPMFPSCKWVGCHQVFATSEELTTHIGDVHVGQGKKMYECLWQGCDRNGDNAFPSKQKVMRHIQKHTGHKPYTCSVCKESFSEAASLQQHQRRHTQERPYVCDFPGCGKTFSFPGGLRIHKRGHSGEKPFKCPEAGCDKAFAESSNLAKHMRIHTGFKPFQCDHPGCGKRFGRKDQLLRHASMHRQRKPVRGSNGDQATNIPSPLPMPG